MSVLPFSCIEGTYRNSSVRRLPFQLDKNREQREADILIHFLVLAYKRSVLVRAFNEIGRT